MTDRDDKMADRDERGRLTRAGMENVIAAGGSVHHDERFLYSLADLPSAAELAADYGRLAAKGEEEISRLRADGWVPPEECDCNRLARCLESGEARPDHICVENARQSCVNWAQEYSTVRGGSTPLVIAFGDRFVHANTPDDWPFRFINGRHLNINDTGRIFLVLRQWVEDEDEKIGRELLDRPMIQELMAQERRLRLPRVQQDVEPTDADAPSVIFPITPQRVEEFRADTLPSWDVPCTPGTARFLLWHIYNQCDSSSPPTAPTKGTLVTSLIVMPSYEMPPDHIYQIAGDSRWDDLTARSAAARLVDTHREWVREVKLYPLRQYKPQRQNPGKPPLNDDLARNITRLLAGQMQYHSVVMAELSRLEEERAALPDPKPLTEEERQRHEKRISKRIADAKKRSEGA